MNIHKTNIRINEKILHPYEHKTAQSENSLAIEKANNKVTTGENFVVSLQKWEIESDRNNSALVRWDISRVPLSYFVHQKENIINFEKDLSPQIDQCFLIWSRASLGKLRFIKSYNPDNSDITIKWKDNPHENRPLESGNCNRILIGNKIDKAIIEIVLFPIIDLKSTLINRNERIRRTLIHEIGHSLGLEHSFIASDIMHHRGIKNNKLSDNDINALNNLYISSKKTPLLS